MANDYLKLNKDVWNKRTEHHIDSEFYNNVAFLKGGSSLNDIELPYLQNVKDKSILHLQCHFGQDTFSLERLGAKPTGVDFSEKAIEEANKMKLQLDSNANFICCDVLKTRDYTSNTFDYVFTSYGTIGWFPDINSWAKVIASSLVKGGQFIMAEFHPVVWMFDDNFTEVKFKYSQKEPIIEEELGSYAAKEATFKLKSMSWNHGISDVLTVLMDAGLRIDVFKEYDYSPYNCFNNTIKKGDKKFVIKGLENKIPMVYLIKATKE